MVSLTLPSRASVTHIMLTPVFGCALVSGFVTTSAYWPGQIAAQTREQVDIEVRQRSSTSYEIPNYRLAGRFAPYKIRDLIHSTSVEPNWIEGTERFWYSWEDNDGQDYYLVDPQAGTKIEIFDNDRIAAELTRITLDPWDGKHLPIRSIRFIDENTLQFEVESSQDEAQEEDGDLEEQDQEEEESGEGDDTDKKVFHFEYDVTTRDLRELANYEAPDNHPPWANVSPDGQTIIFARQHNLYMMSGDDYVRILDVRRGESGDDADDAEEDVEMEEIQLTTDGEEHYSYAANERGPTDIEREEDKDERQRAPVSWSKDSRRFAIVRNRPERIARPVGHPLDRQ